MNLPAATKTLEEIVAKMTASQRLEKFKGMLRERRMTIGALAKAVTRQRNARAHLSQVLSGKRTGKSTWPFLADALTAEELIVLGRDARGAPLRLQKKLENAAEAGIV